MTTARSISNSFRIIMSYTYVSHRLFLLYRCNQIILYLYAIHNVLCDIITSICGIIPSLALFLHVMINFFFLRILGYFHWNKFAILPYLIVSVQGLIKAKIRTRTKFTHTRRKIHVIKCTFSDLLLD